MASLDGFLRQQSVWAFVCAYSLTIFSAAWYHVSQHRKAGIQLPSAGPGQRRTTLSEGGQSLVPFPLFIGAVLGTALSLAILADSFWLDTRFYAVVGKMTTFACSVYMPLRILFPVGDVIPANAPGATEKARRMSESRQPHERARMIASMGLDASLMLFTLLLAFAYFSVRSVIKLAIVIPFFGLFLWKARRERWSVDEVKVMLRPLGLLCVLSPVLFAVLEHFVSDEPVLGLAKIALCTHALHSQVYVLYMHGETIGVSASTE